MPFLGKGELAMQPGDSIPDVRLVQITPEGRGPVSTAELFRGKKAVLFAVPGAFTPTCSDHHLPGFVEHAAELRAKGVELIACTAVNDAFVMAAWGKERAVDGAVTLLADGNGDFARAMGLETDSSAFGMGKRSRRYAVVVEDGVIRSLRVEEPGKLEVSTAEAVLAEL
jgi:glutaredoxin/glutathione-dependent peroxiredoxin